MALLKRQKTLFSLVAVIISLLFCFLAGELMCRFSLHEKLKTHTDERTLLYEYHPELGWFPQKNTERYFQGHTRIFTKHNSVGFRDKEHGIKQKPRILFLGDSFVWGYDVERHQRFTDILQKKIPDWEMINMGVSGYGTDQEFVILKKYFSDYRPDIVYLNFGNADIPIYGDVGRNTRNFTHNSYKPYFILKDNTAVLQGVPVPKSSNYYYQKYTTIFRSYLLKALLDFYINFKYNKIWIKPDPTTAIIKSMNDFCKANGANLIIGLKNNNEKFEKFFSENKIQFVKLKKVEVYSTHGNHWTPAGHEKIAVQLYECLSPLLH